MKKLLLTLAVLCGTVSGWAEGLSDGVYTIKNVIDGRGTLCAVDGQNNVGAASITLNGYEGKSQDAVTDGEKWYVFTLFGKTYLYNLGNKKFLADRSGDVAVFADNAPSAGVSITQNGEYYIFKSADYKLSCCPGYDKGQTIRWLSNDEANSQHLTVTRVENGLNTYKADIDAIKRKIYQSKGYLSGNYVIKNANNKYMISNTHGSDFAGSLFEFYPDLTKEKAYKILSVSEGKWVSYVLKETYDPNTDRVELVENEDEAESWYVKELTGNHSGWYEVSPYDNNGSVSSIYLNWYQGTLTRNVGFWTSGGSSDAGSRWSFIDFDDFNLLNPLNPLSGTEYVLYDEAHKTFLDIKNLGTEPNGRDEYKELATLNSEKQTLYITTTENGDWKIHTTSEGDNYLGQYGSGKTWSSKVNADQNDYVWSVEFTPANSEWYYVLHNQNGIKDGYLGTEGHTNGKELYVDQPAGNKALKLKLHKASLVYKVNATPGIGTVIYDGKRYADGDYIFADSEIAEGDLSLVNVIGYSNTIAWDNNAKVITATYTEKFNPNGLKVLLKNKQHNRFLGVNFVGGELDNDPVPTTHKFSGNSESDYRNCWELQLTTYGSNGSSLPCFVLYNSYYDWYAGKIAGRNTTIDVVKSIDDAGRFEVDCVEETVDNETVKVLTFRCLNKTTTDEYWYLHMVNWGNYGVVDWDYNADASKWYMTEVTDEMIADWNDQVKLDIALFKEYCDAMVRPGIGYYGGLTDEQINIIKNIEVGDEDIDINKARECLYAMHYQTLLVLNPPTVGFYYIKSMNSEDPNKNGKYIQLKADLSGMEEVAEATSKSIIYINENNNLLHYTIGRYQNGYAAPAVVGATADTWQISENPKVKGAYSLKSSSVSNWLSDWGGIGGGQNSTYEAWTFEPVEELPITITSAGYATFYCPVAVTLPDGVDLKAYYVSSTENGKAQMTELVNVIPANTGVILEGEPTTYNLAINGKADAVENLLSGTVASEYISTPSYVLSAQGTPAVVGFYQAMLNFTVADNGTGTKVTEGGTHFLNNGFKAYLPAPADTPAAVRFFLFDFGGEETGITEIENGNVEMENSEVYDLSGRRVQNAKKGIYVVNGKVVVK